MTGGDVNHPIVAQALATDRIRDRIDRATAHRMARGIRRGRSATAIASSEARPSGAPSLEVEAWPLRAFRDEWSEPGRPGSPADPTRAAA
jgi:hypothetical protein